MRLFEQPTRGSPCQQRHFLQLEQQTRNDVHAMTQREKTARDYCGRRCVLRSAYACRQGMLVYQEPVQNGDRSAKRIFRRAAYDAQNLLGASRFKMRRADSSCAKKKPACFVQAGSGGFPGYQIMASAVGVRAFVAWARAAQRRL